MTMKFLLPLLALTATSHAAPPTVSNIRASQRASTKLVDIRYDLADPDSAAITVQVVAGFT